METMNRMLESGDIIELDTPDGPVTAFVLLVSDGRAIIDCLDGTTPAVVDVVDLAFRIFDDEPIAAVA